eukprot:gene7508-biopygen19
MAPRCFFFATPYCTPAPPCITDGPVPDRPVRASASRSSPKRRNVDERAPIQSAASEVAKMVQLLGTPGQG